MLHNDQSEETDGASAVASPANPSTPSAATGELCYFSKDNGRKDKQRYEIAKQFKETLMFFFPMLRAGKKEESDRLLELQQRTEATKLCQRVDEVAAN